MVLVQRHNYKHTLQKTFLPLTHLYKNCKIHNLSHTILLSKPAHQTEEIHNLRLSLSHGFISPWRVFHFSEKCYTNFVANITFSAANFTNFDCGKVKWEVKNYPTAEFCNIHHKNLNPSCFEQKLWLRLEHWLKPPPYLSGYCNFVILFVSEWCLFFISIVKGDTDSCFWHPCLSILVHEFL